MPKQARNKRIYLFFAIVILVALIISIAVPFSLRRDDDDEDDEVVMKVDCLSDMPETHKETCERRKCIYEDDSVPKCYYPWTGLRYSVTETIKTEFGLEAKLKTQGNAPFDDKTEWVLRFENRGENIARITIDSIKKDRYKVPSHVYRNLQNKPSGKPNYEFRITKNNSLSFELTRLKTGTALFSVNATRLALSNQFLQIGTRLPSTNVYGLGEHVHDTFRHSLHDTWPAFARDQFPGPNSTANLYGVHPFYTCVEDTDGNTHGVFMLNSNAQEYILTPEPSLSFRTFGGILDLYVLLGPSPEQAVQQYTQLIGRPVMPPYWALGFQQSRYGYNNIVNLQNAVNSAVDNQIPLDVQYVDIDHMDKQKIFTIDHESFPELDSYFKSLQSQGVRIIYILDPCIVSNATNYEPYERMKAVNGNIKWKEGMDIPPDSSDSDGSILGYVWPEGKVVFPDFFKNSTLQTWKELIISYRDNLTYDGIWIDMNEPANFGTNLDKPWNWPDREKPYWSLKCPKNKYEDPPFRPKACYYYDSKERQARLSDKTICMSTTQGDSEQYSHYDVHNLYGWSQAQVTLEAVREATGERSMVISRSTFPGSGQFVGHWLGDNTSKWSHLKNSIVGMLEFNLFGIPYIGADICGFFQDTTPELCLRWMQLGAFYPFARNHNGKGFKEQGPGQMGEDVANASRDILLIRYRLLPYLYLLFHQSHTTGSTVVRPLHHEYPRDAIALGIDEQFMWGSCLLISPILEKGQELLDYYLPSDVWYDYYRPDSEVVISEGNTFSSSVNLTTMPFIHLRGGCTVVEQEPANNTHFSRKKPLTIKAALNQNNQSYGEMFWDDGVSIDTFERGDFFMSSINVINDTLSFEVVNKRASVTDWDDLSVKKIEIYGVTGTVSQILTHENTIINYTQINQSVYIDVNFPIRTDFSVSWIF